MRIKSIYVLCFIFVLMLGGIANGQEESSPEKKFHDIGEISLKYGVVQLKVEEGINVETMDSGLTFIKLEDQGGSVMLGNKEIKLPSHSKLNIIPGSLTDATMFWIQLSSKSSGELTLLESGIDMKIFLGDRHGSGSFSPIKDLDLVVKEGIVTLNGNDLISYEPKGAKFTSFIIEPEKELSLSAQGFSGAFEMREEEDGLLLGRVNGKNVGLFMGEPEDESERQNSIFFNFGKKKIFGDMSFIDYVYDFHLESKNAEVEIELGDIHFKKGDGSVRRVLGFEMQRFDLEFKINDGRVLIPTFVGLNEAVERGIVGNARTDLFVRIGDEGVHVDESGRIGKMEGRAGFYIRKNVRLHQGINWLDEQQLAYHNKYLLLGRNNLEAVRMAYEGIDPKKGIFFLERGFSSPDAIKKFVSDDILVSSVINYLSVGVDENEIYGIYKNDVLLDDVKKLLEVGIENNFIMVLNEDIPYETLLRYHGLLEAIVDKKWLAKNGEVYANLFHYGISSQTLYEYGEVLPLLYVNNYHKLAQMMRIVPSEIAREYLENGISTTSEILELFNYDIMPNEAEEFKHPIYSKYFLYPSISSDDLKNYGGVSKKFDLDAQEIMTLKIMEIGPDEVEDVYQEGSRKWKPEYTKKWKKLVDERKNALGFKEGRYSLPFLELAYEARMGDKSEKPMAIAILNRADWNGAFNDADSELVELFNTHQLLVYEAATDNEAEKALKDVQTKFGKVDLVVIGAHGYSKLINLGLSSDKEWDEKYSLDPSDISFFETLKKVSKGEKTSAVLVSCSTGKGENPIGKIISDKAGIRVFAPSEDTSSQGFVVDKEGNVLGVNYAEGISILKEFLPSK